jgi:hypothetical protein
MMRAVISARSMTAVCCDEGDGQLIDGVGINTYFGSVNLLDIRRYEVALCFARNNG